MYGVIFMRIGTVGSKERLYVHWSKYQTERKCSDQFTYKILQY